MSDPQVLAAWIIGGLTLLTAILGIVLPKLLSQGRAIGRIHDQVTNSHETNLREDIDDLRALMIHGFQTMGDQMSDIRLDVAWERRERMDLAERMTGRRPVA